MSLLNGVPSRYERNHKTKENDMTFTSIIRIIALCATFAVCAELTEKINSALVKYNMEREIIMEVA